ncbi:MAG: transketolase C-terminal domain-containing protein [Bdellovibrionales bacterium]
METYQKTHKLASTPKKDPKFQKNVKTLDGREVSLADPVSTRAMVACMDMNAVLGGAAAHYGGPAAFAELNSSIYGYVFNEAKLKNKEWYELFHIVNDAGHCENGVYALKANYNFADLQIEDLKKFRSIESKLTGHGEAHLFPEGVLVSNGPLGSGFSAAQGLAVGDVLAKKNRTTILTVSDGAAMEGEAKEALSSIPGLASKGLLKNFICVLSDNNTKLSGRIDEDAFSMKPYFNSLESQGWEVLHLEEGNNLEKCYQTIELAMKKLEKNPDMPILLWAKTTKGIGSKSTVESNSGGHGFPIKKQDDLRAFVEEICGTDNLEPTFEDWVSEIENLDLNLSNEKPAVPKEKIQIGIAAALISAKKQGLPIVSISSDLPGSTGLAGFQKEFPESTIDIGIAESNMVSLATGLSLTGHIPIVDTFAQFGVTKGSLPFIMSSLSQAPMIAIFSHTGFQDAADGASHQSLSYLAMLNSIPNVKTICLSCSSEAEELLGQAISEFDKKRKAGETPHTYVFFLGRENFPRYYEEGKTYLLGDFQSYGDINKAKAVIFGVGSILPQALEAKKELSEKGIETLVVQPSSINNFASERFFEMLTDLPIVVSEDHQYLGGFHSVLAQEAVARSYSNKVVSLAVDSKFGQSAYTADQLYSLHGIGKSAIVKAVSKLV